MSKQTEDGPPETGANREEEWSEYEVPVEGSLGLLALGARGLEAWRKRRAEAERTAASDSTESSGADGDDTGS